MKYFILLSKGILETIIQAIISNNQMFQIIINFRYFSVSITVIHELWILRDLAKI